MARSDINLHAVDPKRLIPLPTNLTYAEDVEGHHANVNKAMGFGTVAGGAAAGTDNATLLGKLILLERDGKATIQTEGVMLLPVSGAVTAGDQVICAASGAVKTVGAATNGRGRVLPIAAPANFVWIELNG
jgi:hypothetical protein